MTRSQQLILLILLVFGTFLSTALPSVAQQEQSVSARKLINKVAPSYPSVARSMSLQGTVKMEALVTSEGTVKQVSVKGGHPVLVQAASNAVKMWKWERASHETVEPVEIRFNPQ